MKKLYHAKTKKTGEYISGSLLFDADWGCWRIVKNYYEIDNARSDDHFAVYAPEVQEDTIRPESDELIDAVFNKE